MPVKKKPIEEITFVKAICAIYIMVFHFAASSKSVLTFSFGYKNGLFGNAIVTMFFVASGALLFYNYEEIESVGKFYIKRAKGIYPMFWLAYISFFIGGVLYSGDLFYHDQPWCLILSFLGLDGYLSYCLPTYYYIGEWFLGAIIILYLLYPALRWGFKKNTLVTMILVSIIYAITLKMQFHYRNFAFRTIPACMMSFTVGMLLIKYKEQILDNKYVFFVCIAIAVFLMYVNTDKVLNQYFSNQLEGWILFVVLFYAGKYVMSVKKLNSFFTETGKLSYPIFLLHHQISDKLQGYQNYESLGPTLIMLAFHVILTYVCAWQLDLVTKAVLKKFKRKV